MNQKLTLTGNTLKYTVLCSRLLLLIIFFTMNRKQSWNKSKTPTFYSLAESSTVKPWEKQLPHSITTYSWTDPWRRRRPWSAGPATAHNL